MDFEGSESIIVRYYTDEWGIYRFNFPACSSETANDGAIPYNSTLATVSVFAYLGKVTDTSVLADETIIADLIDPIFTPIISGNFYVNVKLQYPTAVSYKGKKATLIFQISLTGGGTYPFYFYPVIIK